MVEKVVKIQNLGDHKLNSLIDNLEYWINKTADERISAVEYLRRQYHGSSTRLQRSAKVIQRSQC